MNNRSFFYLPKQELRVQTDASGSRSVVGSVPYNKASSGLPWVESIAPGAFRSALKPGADVLLLRDHDVSNLMGRTTAATLVLTDTPTALNFRCILPNTTQAADLIESMSRGDLNGVSFGMIVTTDKWADDGRGVLTRTISALDLFEISVCSFAAYPDASASLRSVPKAFRSMVDGSVFDDEDNDLDDDCDCERDEDGNKIDPDCTCEDDDDDQNQDENRAKRLSWSERTLLKLDVLKRL
jgi:HK97 family phage prohead protease